MSGDPSGQVLTHSLVTAPSKSPTRWMLFLHGIFGSGANWRTIARRWVTARPTWGAVLVDLRLHGQSLGIPGPHTVAAAARDLRALEERVPGAVRGVLGHSFGGKVALAYVVDRGGDLDDAWILDSNPGARPQGRGSESTLDVLRVLEGVAPSFASRDAFTRELEAAGISPATRDWLAMNVVRAREREREPEAGFRLRLDLPAIRAMLEDYLNVDLWSAVESPPGRVRVHLVIGGRSEVFSPEERARAEAAGRALPSRVDVETLPEAGHWVHVDAPDALLASLIAKTPPDE
jgi:esterase